VRSDPAARKSGLGHAFRAFRHRDYLIFWLGALASNTGTWLSNLAVPYVIFLPTHSALWVAFASLAQLLPGVLLAPVGGALADRFDRRLVLIGTQAAASLVALALWACWVSGLHQPALLLLVVGLSGVTNGFNMPAWQSFVSDLVPREDLGSAVALNSLQFNAARSLGPAVAGVLLAALGPAWAFFINALSVVFVLTALWLVRARHQRRFERTVGLGIHGQLMEGLAYVLRSPGILLSILLSVVVGFFGNPMFQATVVLAEEVFRAGAGGLGVMSAALGAGALLAAPIVSGASGALSLSAVTRWGLLVYGAAVIAFGLAPSIVVAALVLLVAGAGYLAVISSVNTAIQLLVADHMRGRTMAVRHMLYTGSFSVGALFNGWLTEWLGAREAVVVAGAALLLTGLACLVYRGRYGLGRLDDPQDPLVGPAVTTEGTADPIAAG